MLERVATPLTSRRRTTKAPGMASPHSMMARRRMVMDCRPATVRHRSTARRRVMYLRRAVIGCRRAMASIPGTVCPRPGTDDRPRTDTEHRPPMAGGPGTVHPRSVMGDRCRMLIRRHSTTVRAVTTGHLHAFTSRRPGFPVRNQSRTPGAQSSRQPTRCEAVNAPHHGRSAAAPPLQGCGVPRRCPRATGWFPQRS
jgi:hypothetical protein